ncbi:MAG: hypothetical protein A2126_04695 [Candidatus Woykebacteria bacterium GWB1_45_5]|uniref:Large ribosomal subunit protein bL25 n=2 Tax=Candidatus Woykeibacteriota TaxID=1817899 RepID=A0A1G1W472_9BACT|nr:MAG: hypothetical protein A2113_01730 [Candidatus Woykebacteria bacterium GWA1_44_8]OGY22574.1 MAG: hypothetical protein A2126_04695 [Candidatus Woykebacteria bacterium GWB1_45_5]
MEKLKLALEPRSVLGKKVKSLRGQGVLPANLFGKDIKSIALQIPEKDFRKVFKEAGETGLLELTVKNQLYPALIHHTQRDPLTGKIIHVDLHKVNLKEKIITMVPIKLTSESEAEKSGVGLILQTLNELEVESLPADIPHEITLDISNLTEVGQTIHVKDLKVNREKIEVKNDPEEVVVSVQTAEMKEEVVEEAPAPEEVEAIAEKGEEEVAEKTEEGKEEKEEKEAAEEKPRREPQQQ